MDRTQLVILRGKLLALESLFSSGAYNAAEVRQEAQALKELYPDMEGEELQRANVLLKAINSSSKPN